MSNALKITKYFSLNTFKVFLMVIAATLLVHIVASVLVDTLVGSEREAGIVSPLVLMGGFVVGTMVFPAPFRYLSSQGVSRQDYWLSTGFNLAVVSFTTALLVIIYQVIISHTASLLGPVTIFGGMYRNQTLLSMFLWEFSALLFLSTLGWFDRVVAYRSGPKVMIALYAVPVIGIILLGIFNNGGTLADSMLEFFARIFGIYPVPNPYTGILTLVVLTAVLFGLLYFLLRRAQVTD